MKLVREVESNPRRQFQCELLFAMVIGVFGIGVATLVSWSLAMTEFRMVPMESRAAHIETLERAILDIAVRAVAP